MATQFDESENIVDSTRMPQWQKELIQRRKHVSKVIANNSVDVEQGKNDIFLEMIISTIKIDLSINKRKNIL